MSKLCSHSSPVFWTSSAFSITNEMCEYRLYFPSPIQKLRCFFFFLLVSTQQKLIVIKERVIGSSLKSSLDPFSIAWSLSKSVFNLQDDLRASNASFAICPVGFNICFLKNYLNAVGCRYQDSLSLFAELWGRNLSRWGLRRHCLALQFLNSVFLRSLFFP